jgi:hypothetical protein
VESSSVESRAILYDSPTRKAAARVLQLHLTYKLVRLWDALELDEPIVECVYTEYLPEA